MWSRAQTSIRVGNRWGRLADALLLTCGIVYAVSYVIANDVVAAAMYHGYSRWNQATSELSAKGADPRPFLVAMLPIWTALMVAFGIGVWRSARGRRALQVTGGLLITHGIVAIGWVWFPMTPRAQNMLTGTGSNDTGHLVMTGLTGIFVLAELASAAVAFGWWFRLYSLLSALTSLVFGLLVSAQSPNLQDGKPTPRMGLYERVTIGVWLLWMTVLAVVLLNELRQRTIQLAEESGPLTTAGSHRQVDPSTTALNPAARYEAIAAPSSVRLPPGG
jgi:hypothetical protein